MTALSPEHDQAYQRLRMCGHSPTLDYAALDREVARFKAEGGMPPVVRRERAPGRRIGLSSLISIAALAALEAGPDAALDKASEPEFDPFGFPGAPRMPMALNPAGFPGAPRKSEGVLASRARAKAARKARRKSRRS